MLANTLGRPVKPLWPFCLNKASEQAQGLVGWWPGGPSGGQKLWDLSGKNNHGTIAGTLPTKGIWVAGYGGGQGALTLDGSTNSVNCGGAVALNFTGPFSLSVWINPIANGNFKNFVGKESGSTGYYMWLSSTGTVHFGCNAGAVEITSGVLSAVWHLVTGVFTGAVWNLYVDGVRSATTTSSTAPASASAVSLVLGANNGLSAFYKGLLEDFRAYNRALNAAEVAALYAPATRWQLRWQPRRTWFLGVAGGGPWPWFMDNDMAGGMQPMGAA